MKAENARLRTQLDAGKENASLPLSENLRIVTDHIAGIVRSEMKNCLTGQCDDSVSEMREKLRHPCNVPKNWPFGKPDEDNMVL